MDARPLLFTIARVLQEQGLEAILIGNAAAALQGAPVTTLDFDFLFRKTPGNLQKLKAVARSLGAVVLRPYYPASGLFRVMRDEDSLQIDFMVRIHGAKSFASLRSRASRLDLGGHTLLVADLADVIRSKRAADRPRDRAVLDILERALDEKKQNEKG
jgi:predicted nucleotidyltransferase